MNCSDVKRNHAFRLGPVTIRNQLSEAEITSGTKKLTVTIFPFIKASLFTQMLTGPSRKRQLFLPARVPQQRLLCVPASIPIVLKKFTGP